MAVSLESTGIATLKHSLAQKALLLVCNSALTQLLALGGLSLIYLEMELYPQRSRHDKQIADSGSAYALDQGALLHELSVALDSRTKPDAARVDSLIRALRQDNDNLQKLWMGYADYRFSLLHPVERFVEHKVPNHDMEPAARAVAAYLLTTEKALSDATIAFDNPQNAAAYNQALASWVVADRDAEIFSAFVDHRRRNSAESSKNRMYSLSVSLAVFAVTLGSLLSLGLIFNRDLYKRLMVILDNNKRFAAGQSLNPLVSGDDEITELDLAFHEMARTLKSNVAMQKVIIDNAQDMICALDLEGRFISVNSAALPLLGYKPQELTGTWLSDMIDPAEQQKTGALFLQAARGIEQKPFETKALRKDGNTTELLLSVVAKPEQNQVFCTMQDLSVAKAATRLQNHVTELVADNLGEPLQRLIDFHRRLTHQELGAIQGDGARQLAVLDSCSSRMSTLVKDLADSQKAESGSIVLSKSTGPVAYLFEQTAASVSSQAQAQSLTIDCQPGGVQIYADPNRLIQVLVNLVSNSIKFSPARSTITLKATSTAECVTISVADQGRGIPTHLIATVFEKFSQAQFTDAKVKGGSGLGLAICKSLVELHGGDIRVTSQVDVGTVFVLRIPNAGAGG